MPNKALDIIGYRLRLYPLCQLDVRIIIMNKDEFIKRHKNTKKIVLMFSIMWVSGFLIGLLIILKDIIFPNQSSSDVSGWKFNLIIPIIFLGALIGISAIARSLYKKLPMICPKCNKEIRYDLTSGLTQSETSGAGFV